ncbi:MAG: hypothetical protein RQ757_10350, partial [Pseudomonadales bacterium]|nr:hypothetical protein [Pseudomonadales bacterium]
MTANTDKLPFYLTPRFLLSLVLILLSALFSLGIHTWQVSRSPLHGQTQTDDPLAKSERLAALVEQESRQSSQAANGPWQRLQQMQQQMDSLFADIRANAPVAGFSGINQGMTQAMT